MQKKSTAILVLLMMLLTIGCAVPTLPLNSVPANTVPPTVDADTLATLVADAAAQKIAQTLEAIPPTATATETPLPTSTPTELPPTATATPIVYPGTGSELMQGETSTDYYDYTGGYMLTLPENWLPIRPGEIEYAEAWGLPVAAYPEVSSALQSMQSLDPSTFRLFVLDTQDGHFSNSFMSNINLLSAPTGGATLEEIFAQNVLDLPESIPGLVVTASSIEEHPVAGRMGVVTAEWETPLAAGKTIPAYQKQAIFVIHGRSLIVTLTSTVEFKDTILADFDRTIASLRLLR